MPLLKLFAALFPKLSVRLHRIVFGEFKHLEPKEFLQEIVQNAPDELHVRVVGPSMTAVFEFVKNDRVYSTAFYREDGLMPQIYRALLHAAVGTEPRGRILDPIQIIGDHHGAIVDYLGHERMRTLLRSHSWERVRAEA